MVPTARGREGVKIPSFTAYPSECKRGSRKNNASKVNCREGLSRGRASPRLRCWQLHAELACHVSDTSQEGAHIIRVQLANGADAEAIGGGDLTRVDDQAALVEPLVEFLEGELGVVGERVPVMRKPRRWIRRMGGDTGVWIVRGVVSRPIPEQIKRPATSTFFSHGLGTHEVIM